MSCLPGFVVLITLVIMICQSWESVLIQFSSLSISLEEWEDSSNSGSDYEATIKVTKRKKQAVPGPKVNYLILCSKIVPAYLDATPFK